MTTSFVQPSPTRSGVGTAAAIVIGIVAAATILGLLIAGISFAALAIVFPIVVPIANQYHVAVSANDVALAQSLAGIWWVFAILAVASFAAAAGVAVATVRSLSPVADDLPR